jgi:hypothetical protein
MPLSGNTEELSLADLFLIKAMDSRSYRLSLSGPSGDGLMFIEVGRIVHAASPAPCHDPSESGA